MLEILEFSFSGFWSFVGTVVILSTVFIGLQNIIFALRKPIITEEKQD